MIIIKKILKSIRYRILRLYDFFMWNIDRYKYRNVDYFAYKKLCQFHKLPEYNPFQYNIMYGNSMAVSKLYGQGIDVWNDYLEHGLWYSENVGALSYIIQHHRIKKIFTYSDFRKEKIEKFLSKYHLTVPVILVGPYIKGSKNFYSLKELKALKSKLGRTLLVLPMHSYAGVDNFFDKDGFIQEIERIKPSFKTILVCLAFKDVQRDNYMHYLDKGYTLVCNGCPSDPKFLSRHRDLIELADLTMSNGVGTHIGYSISLGVPHYFYYQFVTAKTKNPAKWETMELQERELFALKLRDMFGKLQNKVTQEQIEFVKKYWGNY